MSETEEQQPQPPDPSDAYGQRHPTLGHALLAAQEAAPNVAARRKHYDGYPYASAGDVKDVLLPVLRQHGLVASLAHADSIMDEKEMETRVGGLQWMTDLLVTFRLHHVHSGESLEYRIIGRRTNDKDKGVQHAMSSAEKAFYLRLLGVSEDENEEGPEHAVQPAVPPKPQPRKKQSGARRPRREPPNAPPPAGDGNGSPPISAASDEEKIAWAQARVRHNMLAARYRRYHMEALASVDEKLRERIDIWQADEWMHMEELVRRWPHRLDEAVDVMGKKEPTTKERLAHLNSLLQRCTHEQVPTEDRAILHSAAAAGWHDAVEFWISRLEELVA